MAVFYERSSRWCHRLSCCEARTHFCVMVHCLFVDLRLQRGSRVLPYQELTA